MIQLTEKEARKLIENLYYKSDVTSFVDENLSVKQWKEKGFIKIHLIIKFLFVKYSAIAFVEPLPTPPPKVAIKVIDKFSFIKLSI